MTDAAPEPMYFQDAQRGRMKVEIWHGDQCLFYENPDHDGWVFLRQVTDEDVSLLDMRLPKPPDIPESARVTDEQWKKFRISPPHKMGERLLYSTAEDHAWHSRDAEVETLEDDILRMQALGNERLAEVRSALIDEGTERQMAHAAWLEAGADVGQANSYYEASAEEARVAVDKVNRLQTHVLDIQEQLDIASVTIKEYIKDANFDANSIHNLEQQVDAVNVELGAMRQSWATLLSERDAARAQRDALVEAGKKLKEITLDLSYSSDFVDEIDAWDAAAVGGD